MKSFCGKASYLCGWFAIPRMIALIVLAYGLSGTSGAAALDKVTISSVVSLSLSPVFIAVDRGYFRDEGIDPVVISTPLATDAINMTANGQTDIGATATGVSLFNAGLRGLDLKIVGSMAVHPAPTTVIPLLIRKDLWDSGAVRSGKDLKGKVISTNSPGGSIEYKLALIMARYGMTIADVRETGLGQPDTIIALEKKAIDAAILGEPYATDAIHRGFAVLDIDDSKEAAGDLGSVIVYNKSFMANRHDVAVRAMRAMMRAAKDLQEDNWRTQANFDSFTHWFKTPREILDIMVFPRFEPDLSIQKYVPSLQRQADVHVKDKRMSAAAAAGVSAMIDDSITREATQTK